MTLLPRPRYGPGPPGGDGQAPPPARAKGWVENIQDPKNPEGGRVASEARSPSAGQGPAESGLPAGLSFRTAQNPEMGRAKLSRRSKGHRYSITSSAKRPTGHVQMRWKTSLPRTLTTRPSGPTYVAIHLVATVVGLTKRPDPTVVTLQSDVQFLDVWNTSRGP
jgi:hypothetical protein